MFLWIAQSVLHRREYLPVSLPPFHKNKSLFSFQNDSETEDRGLKDVRAQKLPTHRFF